MRSGRCWIDIYIYIYIYISPRQLQGYIYIYIMPSNIAIRARTMKVMQNQWLRARSDPGPFDKSNGPGSLLDDISVSNCVVYANL